MGRMQVLLETGRLVLRRFSNDVAGNLFDLDGDPDAMRYLSRGTATPRQVIEADILPCFTSYNRRFPGLGFWAAIDKATGAFVEWFSFRPRDEADPRQVGLGFRLRKAAWGRGCATEGTRALIRLGFTELSVQRVVATTYEDNLASRRVWRRRA
jgi:RimJ/RimL family protein N-acetyltransferase